MSVINKKTLDLLVEFIRKESGNVLTNKDYLFSERLSPLLIELKCSSLDHLAETLTHSPTFTLKKKVINAMMTHESFFMREPHANSFVLKFIEEQNKENKKKLFSIWSSASSQGQEIYSLLISLMETTMEQNGIKCEFLATDMSQDVVDKAAHAVYSKFEVSRGMTSAIL